MRKVLSVIFLFTFAACHLGEKKYTIETKRSERGILDEYEIKINKKEIYAKDDSSAYAEGASDFAIEEMVYSKKEFRGVAIPLSFTVYDKDGNDISLKIPLETKRKIEAFAKRRVINSQSGIDVDSATTIKQNDVFEDTIGAYKAPVKVTSTRLIEREYSNYKDISLTYKNVSDKKISAIRFQWYGKTAFGDPADMGNSLLEGYGGGFDDDALRPGKTTTSQWNILSRNAKKIIAAWPTEVVFEDGSKWKLESEETKMQ